MYLLSTAVPHWMPPGSSPCPTSLLHSSAPVAASKAQYTPLFSPIPATSRGLPPPRTRNTFTPEPAKSHVLKLFSHGGHHDGAGSPHASRRASGPAPRNDHRTAPVRRSKAITELKCAFAEKQDSSHLSGSALRHAVTDAGWKYSWPAAPKTSPCSTSIAGGFTNAPPA